MRTDELAEIQHCTEMSKNLRERAVALRAFIEEVLANENHDELVAIIEGMTPDQKKEWEEMFEDYKEMIGDTT